MTNIFAVLATPSQRQAEAHAAEPAEVQNLRAALVRHDTSRRLERALLDGGWTADQGQDLRRRLAGAADPLAFVDALEAYIAPPTYQTPAAILPEADGGQSAAAELRKQVVEAMRRGDSHTARILHERAEAWERSHGRPAVPHNPIR